jgi:hypothetical protein
LGFFSFKICIFGQNVILLKTITFDESLNISKNHFKTLEDFQLHIDDILQNEALNFQHKEILNERMIEANENPDNYILLETLKSSLKRN